MIADLMRRMKEAGAPVEAIMIAVEVVETLQKADTERRARRAEQKRKQRHGGDKGADISATVARQESDMDATVAELGRDKGTSFPPPKRYNQPPSLPPQITELRSDRPRRVLDDPKAELFALMKEKFGPKISSFTARFLKNCESPGEALSLARQAISDRSDLDGAKAYMARIIRDREKPINSQISAFEPGEAWN